MRVGKAFLMAMLVMTLSPARMAAEGQTARNAVLVELFEPTLYCVSMLMGSPLLCLPVSIEYQRDLSEHLVLLAKVGIVYEWPSPSVPSDSPVITDLYGPDGWILAASPLFELDWHPFHGWLNGFFVGLCGALYYTLYYTDTAAATGDSSSYCVALGPMLGWRLLLPARLVADIAWGYGGNYIGSTDINGATTSVLAFSTVGARLSLGFRF